MKIFHVGAVARGSEGDGGKQNKSKANFVPWSVTQEDDSSKETQAECAGSSERVMMTLIMIALEIEKNGKEDSEMWPNSL